jgi:hypothetical protein
MLLQIWVLQTQTNTKIKLGFKRKEQKETEENPGLAHRTVSGALGSTDFKLFTFGFLRPRFAIIYRTVQCTSGATASQRNGRQSSFSELWLTLCTHSSFIYL